MKATFNLTNKDTTASSVLLAAMFVLSASAFFSSAQATAQGTANLAKMNHQANVAAAASTTDDQALIVTATRLVKPRA